MKYLIISGIIVLCIFLLILTQIPIGIEPLTELYLEDHTTLPLNIELNKIYDFSFTTHNLEYQNIYYNYTIEAMDSNNQALFKINNGSFTIKHNESLTINESFSFNKSFERAKIQITLNKQIDSINKPNFKKELWHQDPNYQTDLDIHFWVNEIKK